MKAYQVFEGRVDHVDQQHYDLVATYFNKERALVHCKEIAASMLSDNEGKTLEEGYFYGDGKFKAWFLDGATETMVAAMFEEIEITE